jgi:hypothetical protein
MRHWYHHWVDYVLYIGGLALIPGGLALMDRHENTLAGAVCLGVAMATLALASIMPLLRELIGRASDYLKSKMP